MSRSVDQCIPLEKLPEPMCTDIFSSSRSVPVEICVEHAVEVTPHDDSYSNWKLDLL
ncbi:hypothetical protein PC116_g11272 [Phytophthora cactorum]|nr:hypothetical protein PC114_g20244 [Phytophthora cactorum]KAG4044157.1 hypothetical protein PC123_g20391 [Phytophthora cactorum]KAG4240774.1 hypothetical protein PC116_g11272 [Phytophthora cactorum]